MRKRGEVDLETVWLVHLVQFDPEGRVEESAQHGRYTRV